MPIPSAPLGAKRFAPLRRWVLCLLAPVLMLIAMTPVHAQTKPDPSILESVDWEKLEWIEDGRPTNPGSSYAVISGDLSNGPWVVLNKVEAGNFNQPHHHLHNRFYIYVVEGTWWVGSGTQVNPDNAVPIPAGSHIQHLVDHVHWDGAKNEEVLLLIYGEGPFSPESQDDFDSE